MRTFQPANANAPLDIEPKHDSDDFWAPSARPAPVDMDDRPTLRPTGDFDTFDAYEYPASGVHRIVPLRDASDIEGIEGALLKLLAG